MSNRSGTHYSAPTDADRRPVALGVSAADGITPLPLEVDPATGGLIVAATFSGTVTSAPTFAQNPGVTTPTPAFGLIDSSFRPQVSIASPLPAGTAILGSIKLVDASDTSLGTSSNPLYADILDLDKQGVMAYAQVLTSGDTITPASGKRLKIVKSQILPDPVNTSYNLVTLSFVSIGNFFTCWAGSDSSVWIGAVDEALTITVSSSDNVSVNIRYKQI